MEPMRFCNSLSIKDVAMSVHKVSNEVLKDLSVQYQKTADGEVFKKILERVDKLIYHVVHRLHRGHLRFENLSDLYQTGVVGVYKAALRIPEDEDPERIPAWFVAYIKSEIQQAFPHPKHIEASQFEEVWTPEEDPCQGRASECLDVVFKKMLDDKIISEEDVELITLHRIQKLPLDVIAAMKGVCTDTISSRIHRGLLRIQHQVRILDLKPEDCLE